MIMKETLSDKIKIYERCLIKDNRGWFLKAMTGNESELGSNIGEIYFTSAVPGHTKGGHYHNRANEWFTLVTGKAILILEDIITKERMEIRLDSTCPQTVFIPPMVAHSVHNISDNDFILCAYTDLKYDPADTIPYDL